MISDTKAHLDKCMNAMYECSISLITFENNIQRFRRASQKFASRAVAS